MNSIAKPIITLFLGISWIFPMTPLEAWTLEPNTYRSDSERKLHLIRTLSNLALTDKEKFITSFKLVLEMDEKYSGGVHNPFSRRANWADYALVFIKNYHGFTWSYGNEIDFSFLNKWVATRSFQQLADYMYKLGYVDNSGWPVHKLIKRSDQKLILDFALALWEKQVSGVAPNTSLRRNRMPGTQMIGLIKSPPPPPFPPREAPISSPRARLCRVGRSTRTQPLPSVRPQ